MKTDQEIVEALVDKHLENTVFCHKDLDVHFIDHIRVHNLVQDILITLKAVREESYKQGVQDENTRCLRAMNPTK